jgi:disulfide bond formation protein DsbB
VPACRILSGVLDAMQLITALCALLAGVGAVVLVALKVVAGRSPAAADMGAVITDARAQLTFVVAAASMLGSLYFSESADFVPCTYCWYQRIAMYPIAFVALVGMIRRDPNARWYSLTLASIGLCISTYHYLLEWNPSWESGSCALFGPVCSVPWFRTFGFVSLAFMALCGFAAIIAVNLLSFTPSPERELGEETAA